MQRILLAGLAMVLALHTWACDICGIYLNVQPQDRTTQFSLLYKLRVLRGEFTSRGLAKHGDAAVPVGTVNRIEELYQTVELRADLQLRQRWSLLLSVPLVNHYQSVNDQRTADLYGMGDPLVLARFQLANTQCGPDEDRFVHRLLIGGGVKLPLGRDDMTYNDEAVDADLQPGTGTVDFLASVEYTVRKRKTILASSNVLRFNTPDGTGFRFGHGVNSSLELMRTMKAGPLQVAPSLGGYMELTMAEHQDAKPIEGTTNNVLFSQAGLRAWWRSWMLTGAWQHALINDAGPFMMPNRDRAVFGISYLLNKNNNQNN
ncbi:MAG: hypothetical protein IPJ76_02605 [Flavobacteriales bacterium]|nr:MAG: hypothetical protein IPJ76_02605 [Flavobacteriales bacterium]